MTYRWSQGPAAEAENPSWPQSTSNKTQRATLGLLEDLLAADEDISVFCRIDIVGFQISERKGGGTTVNVVPTRQPLTRAWRDIKGLTAVMIAST